MGELQARGARMKLRDLVDAYERRLIEEALRASGGNQRRAAAALGVLPTTLHEKMKRLGLVRQPAPLDATRMALAG
jgi:DNA-binding NtrC family response regulator